MYTSALIAASGTTLITVPATLQYAVVLVTSCNYSVSSANLDVHVIPNGLSASNQTKVISNRTLAAGDSLFLDTTRLLLSAGDVIKMVASIDGALNGGISYTTI